MYLAIIILPLLGSIVAGFLGRKVGVQGSQFITCSSIITTTILAIIAFLEVGMNNIPVSLELFRWVDSESLNVLWSFNFDSLTVSMLIPVLIVSSLVHVYSIGYMSHDPHNQRFFSYLSFFTFMMIILVTANNFLLMFVGWEGVGICSYLLVSFWFTRIAANQSSISAFLTNRVGDCFLTIGIFAILWSFGNIEYSTVFSLAPFVNENIVTIIGICLLIGAMAKSSQVGLHVWLPMAMEGLLSRALLKLHYMQEYPVMNSWSSVHLVNFGKIPEEGQSAGNFVLDKGSSETTREAIKLDENFKWWFIGFTEGDKSFILNKDGSLEFKITLPSVDSPLLFFIKKQLGFGSVFVSLPLEDEINKTYHFIVRDKNNIFELIQIFNGNLLTKCNLNEFKLWVEGFNKKYKMDILCFEPKHKLNLDNAWLSGFTDAKAYFTSSVNTSDITGKTTVTVRYVIYQEDDIEFSKNLADMLNGYITYVKSYNGYKTVVNHAKLNKIIKYIQNNPLKTQNRLSYSRWIKLYLLLKNKKNITPESLIFINLLTNPIKRI